MIVDFKRFFMEDNESMREHNTKIINQCDDGVANLFIELKLFGYLHCHLNTVIIGRKLKLIFISTFTKQI
jgi:hypothetical protein